MSQQQQRVWGERTWNNKVSRAGALSLAAATTVLALSGTARAATVNWIAPANTPAAFEDPLNWSDGTNNVDPTGHDAHINDSGVANATTYSGTVNSLNVGSIATEAGTLNVNGANINSTGHAVIGNNGGTGTLNLSNGSVTALGGAQALIGWTGPATLNVSGGTLGGFHTQMALGAGAPTTVTQTGGTVQAQAWIVLGQDSPLTYDLSAGLLTNGPGGEFAIGHSSPVTFNLSGSGAITAVAGSLKIGYVKSDATVNMTGGSISAAGTMILGEFALNGGQSHGKLNMDAGSVDTVNITLGGNANTSGTIIQTGGNFKITNIPVIGESGRGEWNISGGTLDATNPGTSRVSIRVGARTPLASGGGRFRVSGTALANIGESVVVGGTALTTGEGLLEVSGGTLNVGMASSVADGTLGIGVNGKGIATISGGTVNADWIRTGYTSSSATLPTNSLGEVTMTGGTVNVAALGPALGGGAVSTAGDMNIGRASDKANFWQVTGGTINVADQLTVAELSTDPSLTTSPTTAMSGNGRLTIDGTASVVVSGELSSSRGWTPATGDNTGKILPGGTGLIEVKGGSLTAASFLNGRTPTPEADIIAAPANSKAGPGSASYVQTGGTASVGHVSGFGTVGVSGGTMNVNSLRQSAATVSGTGTITVAPNAGAAGTSNVGTLSITDGGKLDLRDNKLITNTPIGTYNGTAYDGVHGMIARAYNFGAWDQPGLTTSEPNAGQNAGPLSGTTTIGVATAEQVMFLGPTETGVFMGQTVTGASTIAMYTYAGDVNFDGLVDGADYGTLDNWIQFPGTSGYANGDVNYDGVIDGADYGVLDNTIQLQGDPFPGVFSASGSGASANLSGVTAVPEPASAALVGLVGAGMLARRRPRRRE